MKSFEGSIGWTFPDLNLNEFSASISDTPELMRLSSLVNQLKEQIAEKDNQIDMLNSKVEELAAVSTSLIHKVDAVIGSFESENKRLLPIIIEHANNITAEISKKIIGKELKSNPDSLLLLLEEVLKSVTECRIHKIILNKRFYDLLGNLRSGKFENIQITHDVNLAGTEVIFSSEDRAVKFDLDALISKYMD